MLNTHLLDAPRSAVVAARERLAQATAALSRGQAACTAAADRLRALDGDDAAQAAEYSRRCEQAAVDGVPAVPYLESAPDAAERHRAQIEARGAAEALERLTAAHAAAQADVVTAERALREAGDQALDAHCRALMKAAQSHLVALEQIGADLAELLPDSRFETACGLPSEPAARELLKQLPARPRSDIDVPVHQLREGGPRLSRLAELRAELMAEQPDQPEHQAAA